MKIIDNQTMYDKNFLEIRKNNIILSTTLMISTKIIDLRLSESIMHDRDFFIINIIITQSLAYLIRKSISFIFHILDI